jgi:hypothetical protein
MADEQDVIFETIQIYNRTFSRGETLTSPDKAKDCIKLKLAPYEHEVFVCLFLTINTASSLAMNYSGVRLMALACTRAKSSKRRCTIMRRR